jgi:hypothetical protein
MGRGHKFTPKADVCGATSDVRHGPKANIPDLYGCENGHGSALMCAFRAKSYLQTDPKSSHGAWEKALSGIFK